MARYPNAPAAYNRRHLALAEQLNEVESETATKQIELAMFVSSVVVATILDLSQLVKRASDTLKSELDAHHKEADAAVVRFETAIADVTGAESTVDGNMNIFLAAVSRLQVQSSYNAIEIAVLRCQLIQTMSLMWLELMERLYESDDRRIFFARLEKLIEYASSKLPIVGEPLEALKTAIEIYAIRTKEALDADKYLLSLESYVDAANVYLTGAIAFCESAERALTDRPEPSEADIQRRIAAHIAAVSSRTHALSARISEA
jgi:hypothetical protein